MNLKVALYEAHNPLSDSIYSRYIAAQSDYDLHMEREKPCGFPHDSLIYP